MKVVLFCGGLGLRMRSGDDSVPKPMMSIGHRPALWHIMRYYAYFGHTDFILCLGYGARAVKDYFLNYHETHSNDFVLTKGGDTSSCSTATSVSGALHSLTLVLIPPLVSGCGVCGNTLMTTRSSWQITATY